MKDKKNHYDGFVNAKSLNQVGLFCTGFTSLGLLMIMGTLLVVNHGFALLHAAVVLVAALGFAGGMAAASLVLVQLRRRYHAASAAQFMYFTVMGVTAVTVLCVVGLAEAGHSLTAMIPMAMSFANIGLYCGCEERKFTT